MSNTAIIATEIQIWPIERLVAYAGNPRKHPGSQIEQIAASLREYGVVNPALVDSQGTLIAGHGRVLAARRIGLLQFPVIILDHLTEAQVRALRIADNKLAENAVWDEQKLSAELAALLEQKIDLESLGFSELELKRVLAQLEAEAQTDEDQVPETSLQSVTQPGDLWILGDHRIVCGDATVLDSAQRLLEGKPAHMIFTDPPYNVSYLGTQAGTSRTILNDNLGAAFGQFLREACQMMLAVSGGAIYICMSSSELHTLHSAFTHAGGHWSTFLIWAKDSFTLGRSDFQRQYEPILYGWKEGSPHFWCGARNLGDVWHFHKPRVNNLHPTMKPVELIEHAILHSSRRGDTVFDPFGGSGSTLIACQKTRRRARLMELDPKYVEVTIQRWQTYSGQTARLASSGQTWDELIQETRKAA